MEPVMTPQPEIPVIMPSLTGIPYALPKNSECGSGTIADWCLKKQAPAWLQAAMSAMHPVNRTFTEAEFITEARRISGFALGR